MSRVAAGDVYWIVACSAADQGREVIYSILRNRVQKNALVYDSAVFDVPSNLKFGSFDDLIRMADDLVKHDQSCEQIARRLERQILEIDSTAELRIFFQRNTMPMEQFLHRFMWDETKYPRTRYMKDNIQILMASITRIDDEVRIKSSAFNEVRHAHQSASSQKEGTAMTQRDLIDVLTPEVVKEDDFIETEHLTTAVAIVPSGLSQQWITAYEHLDPFVIPKSTRQFENITDKEGNTIWKFTLFRSSLEACKSEARSKRFIVREFKYNPDAIKNKREERARLEAEKSKQQSFMSRVCMASFSDVCVAWIHLKAMRIFVESVLRFGVEANFAAFLLKPRPSKVKKLRKELEDIFTTKGMFGRAFIESAHRPPDDSTSVPADIEDTDAKEYFPYVSLSFVPFQLFTQK